ncbi:MAG: carboxypeptidase regulatory-like domain-containing protein [Elainellaceae cyanobacterium]
MLSKFTIRRCAIHLSGSLLGALITASLSGQAAIAHGVDLVVEPAQSLQVKAAYDSGEPMTDAAVVIYAPDNPEEPWATGTTDEQGYFTFVPDRALAGNWDIQVRQAGHGDIVSVPVSADSDRLGEPVTAAQLTSPLQKGLMIGSVFWGCLGTALFFSTRTRHSNPET